jgi:hypothetical protein
MLTITPWTAREQPRFTLEQKATVGLDSKALSVILVVAKNMTVVP